MRILYNSLQIASEQWNYIVWVIAGIMPCPQLKHITNAHVCTEPFPAIIRRTCIIHMCVELCRLGSFINIMAVIRVKDLFCTLTQPFLVDVV